MGYNVEFTPAGIDNLEELTPIIQERILRKIRWLSENPDIPKIYCSYFVTL